MTEVEQLRAVGSMYHNLITLIATLATCSKSEAARLIKQGAVEIDGTLVPKGTRYVEFRGPHTIFYGIL